MVKGKKIPINEMIMVEVTGLSREREKCIDKHIKIQSVMELFTYPSEELVRKGK